MSRTKSLVSLFLVVAFLAVSHPAVAEQGSAARAGNGKNVLVTLTISKTGGSGPPQKVYKLVGQDESEAQMLVGWRTPIPTVTAARDDSGKPPMTSFTYQNIGVSARMMIHVLEQGRITLQGGIEISGEREGPAVGPGGQKAPIIGTFQQNLKVTVSPGKKVRIAEGPDPEGGTVSLDIEAVEMP